MVRNYETISIQRKNMRPRPFAKNELVKIIDKIPNYYLNF